MGRPKLEDPKSAIISIRLDKKISEIVSEACEKEGKNRSELVRDAIFWYCNCDARVLVDE